MSVPTPAPTPFMRRAGLIAWLAQHGFTASQVDNFIREGVIPRAVIPRNKSQRPRGFYRRDEVAAKLGITL